MPQRQTGACRMSQAQKISQKSRSHASFLDLERKAQKASRKVQNYGLILDLIKILKPSSFSVSRPKDEDSAWLTPRKGVFTSGVCSDILVCLEHDSLRKDLIGLWVYVWAARYELKKKKEVVLTLCDASRLQIKLLARGYAYDEDYCCHDGSVVLGKKIPLHKVSRELKVLANLLILPRTVKQKNKASSGQVLRN